VKDDLTVTMEDKFFKLAADRELKMSFETTTSIASFWIKVKAEYPELAKKCSENSCPIAFNIPPRDWLLNHECH
jgi:hypothetical protein